MSEKLKCRGSRLKLWYNNDAEHFEGGSKSCLYCVYTSYPLKRLSLFGNLPFTSIHHPVSSKLISRVFIEEGRGRSSYLKGILSCVVLHVPTQRTVHNDRWQRQIPAFSCRPIHLYGVCGTHLWYAYVNIYKTFFFPHTEYKHETLFTVNTSLMCWSVWTCQHFCWVIFCNMVFSRWPLKFQLYFQLVSKGTYFIRTVHKSIPKVAYTTLLTPIRPTLKQGHY